MTKTTKRTILIVAISMALIIALGAITAGFQQWSWDDISARFEKTRNPANKIQTVELESHRSSISDVTVDVDELGVVTLNGNAAEDEDFIYATVSLPVGTYQLTGAPGGGKATYFLALKVGETLYRSDMGTVFTIDSTTTCQVIIRVYKDTVLKNVKIMPVLVKEGEPADFYE